MLLISMACWVLRYALFAQADAQTHALLYWAFCFMESVMISSLSRDSFVDKVAPDEVVPAPRFHCLRYLRRGHVYRWYPERVVEWNSIRGGSDELANGLVLPGGFGRSRDACP